MGNPDRAAGVGPPVLDTDTEVDRPSRRWLPEFLGGRFLETAPTGIPSWQLEKTLAGPRLRRAGIFAIVVHVIGAIVLLLATHPRPRPPIRLEGVPVELVSIASPPPSLRQKPRPAEVPADVVREEKPKAKQTAKPVPVPPKKEGVPVPTDKKGPGPTQNPAHAAPRDSVKTLRSEVPLAGGALGALEIGATGPLSAYSYYLQAVRDKIASYWDPPAGIVTGGREVAAMVSFRIDRRGNIGGSYVEEPAGMGIFDAASLRAVSQANPLPPLPQDFPGDWVGIHLKFVYQE